MKKIILYFCYFLYVNSEYSLYICEPDTEISAPLIEVTEGDGYKKPEKMTFSELNSNIYNMLYGENPVN